MEGQNPQEEYCNTELGLTLGLNGNIPKGQDRNNCKHSSTKSGLCLDLSFNLCPKEEKEDEEEEEEEEKSIGARQGHEEHANNKRIDFVNVDNISISRKKLRLTKDQSALLEDSFKVHTTLNPVQKHALAEQLNLTARQVEVWFQNRRARTKLKQTEVDCEFLKKCCESLSEENTRLKKEVQELQYLKSIGTSSQLCLHFPMCPSCEKTAAFGLGCGPLHQ
ncbi:hypothetical protein JCGZ_25478 [Jatropha curcas]|uniref:Homeobox domain-containing protein n=1 Tax=Jatropha curcas TaxID=180498 RepID=A0A067JXN2_JATCU|nr:homeobox-leucine zipper protein HAT22 [Jatropha curcas]KDP24750.1 hypothetical protein JCGZ_25478 [Jatropha curcas]